MRFGLTITAALGVVLLGGSVFAAVPAHASTAEAYVQSDVTEEFGVSCASASTCNTVTTGTEVFPFGRTGSTASSLGIYYKVVNGSAVNGVEFSTPTTGEVIIPAGQATENLSVPLLYSGLYGAAYDTFSIEITGTTTPITLENTTATGGIEGGNIPSDCSFTYEGGLSLALTCTGRPPTQVWYIAAQCGLVRGMPSGTAGSKVTGEGTSTISCGTTIEGDAVLNIES